MTGLAEVNHRTASLLAERVSALPGVKLLTERFFNEFALDIGRPAAPVVEALAALGILGGVPATRLFPGEASLENVLILAATETVTETDIDRLVSALQEISA